MEDRQGRPSADAMSASLVRSGASSTLARSASATTTPQRTTFWRKSSTLPPLNHRSRRSRWRAYRIVLAILLDDIRGRITSLVELTAAKSRRLSMDLAEPRRRRRPQLPRVRLDLTWRL
jgi:hypothetical protein